MKTLLFFLAALLALHVSAQTDSTKKFRISGYQLDFSLVGSPYDQASQAEFKKHIRNNELLNRDLSGYQENGWAGAPQVFPGYFSAKAFIDLPNGTKPSRLELVVGLRYGSTEISSAGYYKKSYDTTGTFVNQANNQVLFTVNEYGSWYQYSITAKQVLVPLGVNFSTSKSRRFWLTAGVELAPGLTFSHMFTADYSLTKRELVLTPSSRLDKYDTYQSNFAGGSSETSKEHLAGTGFIAYATVPVSVNLRLAKRVQFLKHLHATAYVAPGYCRSVNEFSGSNSRFVFNSGLGLRYHLSS